MLSTIRIYPPGPDLVAHGVGLLRRSDNVRQAAVAALADLGTAPDDHKTYARVMYLPGSVLSIKIHRFRTRNT
jgi:hypothetical protein